MGNTNCYCQYDNLSKFFEKLNSNNFMDRQGAQNALTNYIDKIDESERGKLIDKLLMKIHDKETPPRLKVGISSSIGQISTFFWKVKDQAKAEKDLYELYIKTDEKALKTNLDNALMKAEGLYWDAIYSYNYKKPTPAIVNKTVSKFERVFNEFPKSTYASRANYYLAKYYTRVYLIRKDSGDDKLKPLADKNKLIAEKSNSTYHEFFKRIMDGKYKSNKEIIEAHYYLALNWVLLGKFDNAIKELEKIIKSPDKDDFPIYVWEYYYTKGNGNVRNKYYPSDQLAAHTIKYLKKNPQYNENYQEEFVKDLNSFGSQE